MRNPNHSLWHLRLDHISPSRLSKISNISCDLSFNSHQACDIFHRSKQTRLPFPISYNKSSECFSLIHFDIWGRYSTSSHTGAHYLFYHC